MASPETRVPFTELHSILKAPRAVQVIMKTEKGKSLYTSVITDYDTECFYITPPRKGKMDVALKEKDVVRIIFYADDAMYEFSSDIMGFRLDQYGGKEYQCVIPRKGWRVQRRNFYRLPIHLDAQYRPAKLEQENAKATVTPQGEYMPSLITDLSGGGIAFQVNEQIAIGDFVELCFSLETAKGMRELKEIVKVVRALPARTGTKNAYAYRCGGYFFAIDERLRNEVIRFAMEKQVEFFGKNRR